ncbi:MAG: helix-turn-helix transcriptional regulator [Gammaproteobacteria bacterium]|nr:helix-turn-helix transcriptional regulator [Gammaproteobacteria bacterium]MCY4276426.1 helix-turn-helix transcriptional regulator [Gammaproteobacteria bacterium]MCY4322670.1 helix-turn-helix transcriptional regulator [Gammaproteobacteria bacterium]
MRYIQPRVRHALVELGDDISIARRRRRIRQSDLAAALQISRSTLQRVEAGDPGVSLAVFASVCAALGHLKPLQSFMYDLERDTALLSDPPPLRIRRSQQ